jgi:hypothetical protein
MLSVVPLAAIQKPVPNLPMRRPVRPPRQTAVATKPETVPVEESLYALPEPSMRPISLTQEPRGWILSDSTWKAVGKFPLKLDCKMVRGQPYVGFHVVIPFGG